jgi:hyperosmotically inducible protein
MKKQITYLLLAVSIVAVPLTFTTGCAVTRGSETAGQYAKDKEIAARIKTALYGDPVTKGTEIEVQSLRGQVQLSGFVDSAASKERAGQIAASTPGVVTVYNNLLLPTGR